MILLTLQLHSCGEALVEATSGALFARGYGNRAAGTTKALVIFLVLYRSFEESLTAFA